MLKKLSTIFLVVASGLMMTAAPIQADIVAPGTMPIPDDTVDRLPPLMPPDGISIIKYCSNPRYASSRNCTPASMIRSILMGSIYLPIYFILFIFNYVLEYIVSLIAGLSKRVRFAPILLLMNLATHPLLTLINELFPDLFSTYLIIGLLEFIVVVVEALILKRWWCRNQVQKIPPLAFIRAFELSIVINLASFLVGELFSDRIFISHNRQYLFTALFIIEIIWVFWLRHQIAKPKSKLQT